jgi:O-antigen/teichoic acid export membrane protein
MGQRNPIPMTSLKKSGLITFLTQVSVFIFGFATSIILARVLGPEDRGIYALIILIPAVMGLLGTLGMDIANIYFSANKKYKLSDIISNSLVSSIGLGLVIILLFWVASTTNAFQEFLIANNITFLYLWLAVFTVPIVLLSGFFNRILLGREEIVKFNSVGISKSIFQLGLIFLFLIVLDQGVFGAVLAYIVTTVCVALLVTLFIKKLNRINFSINFGLLKESLRYGGKGYLGNVAQFLNYRLDMLLVAYFLDVTAVGYYTIAVGMAERLWMIPGSIGTVLFPRVSAIADTQANQLTSKVSRHTLFIVFILSIVLIVLAKPLILIFFGISFLPSVEPLMILLPGIVALSFAKVLTSDLAGRGTPEFGTYASIVSLAVNIPLNLYFIPKWGISGAAFASSIAYILATLIIVAAFIKISEKSWFDILLINKQDFQDYKSFLHKL